MIPEYQEILRRRTLIHHLVEGQQRASVQRTLLGTLWFALVPLTQIGIYYFLVVVIFGSGGETPAASFLAITMGIMHYAFLNNVGTYVQPAIYSNAPLLLQVKIEPLVLVAAGFLRNLRVSKFGLLIFLILFLVLGGDVGSRLLFYPVVLTLWLALCWMIGIWVATAAVYLRDMERLFPILLQILMYASPVIYSVDMFPERYLELLLLNPIASVFTLFQWIFLGADTGIVKPLGIVLGWIAFGALGGHAFYRWGRRRFTKVL